MSPLKSLLGALLDFSIQEEYLMEDIVKQLVGVLDNLDKSKNAIKSNIHVRSKRSSESKVITYMFTNLEIIHV